MSSTASNHNWIKANKNSLSFPDGFTLVETMVALAVMAIVLVTIYQLHIRTVSMNIDAKFYTMAPFLAQKKLAEIELPPLKEAFDGSGDFGDDFPGYAYKIGVSDVATDMLGSVAEDMKEIRIVISYNDEFTYDLKTYRLDRK